MDPPLKYSRSYKHLNLGMPKASPSSSTIIGFSHGTIFLFLYTLCAVLRASVCFYFQFVCVSFLVLAIIRIHACLFGRETRSAFSLYTPVLHLYVLSVQPLSFMLLALVFKHILFRAVSFCSQEVLLMLLHPFSFVSNKLIGVWLSGNYHVGSVKGAAQSCRPLS